MNLLIISYYYPPDLSACAFRTKSIVDGINLNSSKFKAATVITTFPNRYSDFKVASNKKEVDGIVTIIRVALPKFSRNTLYSQAISLICFGIMVFSILPKVSFDIIFVTTGRMLTSTIGALISILYRKPYYLDIRDIFLDNIRYILNRYIYYAVRPIFSIFELFSIKFATKINLNSPGFNKYFLNKYSKEFSNFTNGVDEIFINNFNRCENKIKSQRINILYAGNIGDGQGLEIIVPKIAKKLEGIANFIIIGSGSKLLQLKKEIHKYQLNNVVIRPPIAREQLVLEYKNADILFIHLNDIEAFKKVLPSKLFEYAATGKPILAGVSGYAREFIETEISINAKIFEPCNVNEALVAFSRLNLDVFDRPEFISKYSRKIIATKMIEDIFKISQEE